VSQKLSDALGEVLAMVEKATPGDVKMRVRPQDESIYVVLGKFPGDGHAQGDVNLPAEDVAALVESMNLLRQHGPALAAIVRAVEGAETGILEKVNTDVSYVWHVENNPHAEVEGQRVALVPLDAADDGRGG
jgi:hypothetical protein